MNGQVEKSFNVGLTRATVWKNPSNNGAFRTVSLRRGYQKDGKWQNTNSLGVGDMAKAIRALEQARDFLEPAKTA